jgi:hypothetical protein
MIHNILNEVLINELRCANLTILLRFIYNESKTRRTQRLF